MNRKEFIALTALFVILWFPLSAACPSLVAQTENAEIESAIQKVDSGQAEEVRKILPDLVAKYPNTSGSLYLQGRLATDGLEAVKFYQGVVDNFPKSEWADDALFRIYQYYYSLGLYRTADLKMQQLRTEYPNSPYVTGKAEPVLPATEEQPIKLPTPETVSADTQRVDSSRSAPAPKPEPKAITERYTLQVGAFATAANAEKQKNFLEQQGYAVEVTNKVRGGRSLYLVWVGGFPIKEDALRFGRELKRKFKLDSMIVERD